MRDGLWQSSVGIILAGRTLGLLGLGNIGRRMAEYGRVFGMDVIAWSQNLTEDAAAEVGVRRVEKDALFAQADILSIPPQAQRAQPRTGDGAGTGLDEADRYLVNTSPRADCRRSRADCRAHRNAGSRAPASTCSMPNRRRPTITCESWTMSR